jgi:hypothetical protein
MKAILAALTLALAAGPAPAEPYRVSWPIAPAQVGVSFRVVNSVTGATLGETSDHSIMVNAEPGDRIAVIAFNEEFGEAPPSNPITLPSSRVFAVTIQASTDLRVWRDVTVLLPEEMTADGAAGPRLFIRQKRP